MTHDVFISYSRKDKQIAEMVCRHLEQNDIRCWVASRDISPGKDWAEAIVDAISGSRLMLLIFSSNANDSSQINREVNLAADERIPIVPFRIENVQPSKRLKYYLSTPHWLDALPPPPENHFAHLVKSVKTFLPELSEKIPADIKKEMPPKIEETIKNVQPDKPAAPPNQNTDASYLSGAATPLSENFLGRIVKLMESVKSLQVSEKRIIAGSGIFLAFWLIIAFSAFFVLSYSPDRITGIFILFIILTVFALVGIVLAYFAKTNLLYGVLGGALAFASWFSFVIAMDYLGLGETGAKTIIFNLAILTLIFVLYGMLTKFPILWIGGGIVSGIYLFVGIFARIVDESLRFLLFFGIVGLGLVVFAVLKNRKLHQQLNISGSQDSGRNELN